MHPPPCYRSAVSVLRSERGLPPGLAVLTYVAFSTPMLAPFIPLYAGLPGDALPPELTAGTAPEAMDPVSLFWRARRLQALVFQVGGSHLSGWVGRGRRHPCLACV